jgi:hypothetical protein
MDTYGNYYAPSKATSSQVTEEQNNTMAEINANSIRMFQLQVQNSNQALQNSAIESRTGMLNSAKQLASKVQL